MHMYFWFGYEKIQMPIKPWLVQNVPDLVGSVTGLFMVGIIYEFLKVYREVKTNGKHSLLLTVACYDK